MSAEARAADAAVPWLQHVPVPLFAVVMGLGGLGLAWRSASDVFEVSSIIGEAMLLVTAAVAVVLLAAATLIIAAVTVRTAQALVQRRLFQPEGGAS